MKIRIAIVASFVIVSTAMAVILGRFTSWNDLTQKSPDIILARCTATTSEKTPICDGEVWSDIEVVQVLKGNTKPGAARMVSQYWPHQGERFLMFAYANVQTNQFHHVYNAMEAYRIVPLSRYFWNDKLSGKPLEEQIRLVLSNRLEDVSRELQKASEEKARLEGGLFGCGSSEKKEIHFMHPHAVFLATAGGDTATCPVWKNYAVSSSGAPERYEGSMFLKQGAIQLKWQYMGVAESVPAPQGRKGYVDADVYVLRLTTPEKGTQVIPFVYRGGDQVVLERKDLKVVLKEEKSAPNGAAAMAPAVHSAVEVRPKPADIKVFVADPMPHSSTDYFKDFKITRKEFEGILNGYFQVSEEHWKHGYSHVAFGDRTGHVILKDGRKIRWMVRPGGLAWLEFPSGRKIYLARERTKWPLDK